jgi:hypothetical protein
MPIDNEDLVLDAADPLARAHGALRIIRRYAEQADRIDDDPMSLVDGRHQRLAAAQRAYTEHAKACALVALAGDVRRIADQLDQPPPQQPSGGTPPTGGEVR